MKAFQTALISLLLGVFLVSPTIALAQQPTQDFNLKTFTPQANTSNDPTITPTPSVKPGTIQLLPPATGKYEITNPNPNNNSYQITQAAVGDCLYFDPLPHFDPVACFNKIREILGTFIEETIYKGVGYVLNVPATILTGCSIFQRTDADIQTCLTNTTNNVASSTGQQAPAGLLFKVAGLSDSLLDMPLPIDTQSALAHLNPFSQANAASGFADLQTANKVYDIWKNARNAAYAFSIIILVVVGFLIMFRTKIDPRTSVTISNALPKIVIMLLLITFSYAIGGLLIDGMRVLSGVLKVIVGLNFGDFLRFYPALISSLLTPLVLLFSAGGVIVGTLIAPGAGTATGLAAGSIIAFLLTVILVVIITIYIFVVELIVIYHIVIRYAQFVLGLIFAPLIFLAVPLPNGMQYLLLWLKKETAFLLTMPISIAILAIAFKVSGSCFPSPWDGILGQVTGNACKITGIGGVPYGLTVLGPLIALGIFSIAMKAPAIADELLGNKPLTGRGGGGDFDLDVLLGLSALKSAGNAARAVTGIQTLAGNYGVKTAANNFGLKERETQAEVASRNISDPQRKILKANPLDKPIMSKAQMMASGKTAEQEAMNKDFESAGITPAVVASSDNLDLMNMVRKDVGFPQVNSEGFPVGSFDSMGNLRHSVGRALTKPGTFREGLLRELKDRESTILGGGGPEGRGHPYVEGDKAP